MDLVALWQEAARRDDVLDEMVPSDVRLLVQQIEQLRKSLIKHHQWHLGFGDVSVEDGKGGYVTWDLSEAYMEGGLGEETTELLNKVLDKSSLFRCIKCDGVFIRPSHAPVNEADLANFRYCRRCNGMGVG